MKQTKLTLLLLSCFCLFAATQGQAQAKIKEFLMTFKDFPQRQAIGSFSLDKVLDAMNESANR